MFDWNDEELANIIWGEAADSDDHIVPYREASENEYDKKKWNQDAAYTKLLEQKSPGTNVDDTDGRKLESHPGNEEGTSASNLSNDPLVDLSLSKPCRIDHTEVSCELTENSKYKSPKHAAISRDAEDFQSTEEGKEQADFVDYGWANIGSFDDLDRIFSNDDQIFGQVSLSGPDELWPPSSKDVSNSAIKLFPTMESGVDTGKGNHPEYLRLNEPISTLSNEQNSDAGLLGLQTGSSILTDVKADASGVIANDRKDSEKMATPGATALHQRADIIMTANELSKIGGRKKRQLKSEKKTEGKSEEKMFQDYRCNWPSSTNPSGQFDNNLALQLGTPSPSVIAKHSQLQGVEPLQYQQTTNHLVHQPFYAIAANAYPGMPLLSQMQLSDLQHQPLLSHGISPVSMNRVDKPTDGFAKSLTMTPQEKIEKLRRRQQMQAMLAIKKQQQFKNQASTSCQSISPKCPQEVQSQHIEKTDFDSEEIYTLPTLDPKSPLEQDDSNTIFPTADHCSMEETVLCRLQEIISKLDFKIRLCIRDSLFRLAQSATQRHNTRYEHDNSAKGEVNSHCRIAGVPDSETETNPIDRTVAHLLFHRPFELLQNYPDAPESPISSKLSYEQKAGLKSSPTEFLPHSASGKHCISLDGSKSSWTSAEMQAQIKTSCCMDTSDNTSNTGPVDDAVLEYEASHSQ